MSDTIMQQLRDETAGWHQALETTPFSLALLDRTLPLERYVGQLAAYHVVLGALETQLIESTDPTVVAVWRPDLAKLALLEQDLEYFCEVPPCDLPTETLEVAQNFAGEIDRQAEKDPISLLGFLYVLEGSTLGGLELTAHVQATFDLDRHGLAYYRSGDRNRWAGFGARMNAALGSDSARQRVLHSADVGYQWVADTIATLSHDDHTDLTSS